VSGWKVLHACQLATTVLLALSALSVTGCASTKVEAQWTDPQFVGRSLRGAVVLVVCDANEPAIKRICQDKIAGQVAVSGATPALAPESADLTVGPPPTNDVTLAAARSAGATAILASTITPAAVVVNPGPTFGFGFGGFGGSGNWGTATGVGISVPVGGAQVDTGYAASMTLTDVATVRLMWTSKVTTPAGQNVDAQLGELARAGMEAARKAGLF